MSMSFTRFRECAHCGVQTTRDATHCATCDSQKLRDFYRCSGCGKISTQKNCKNCSPSQAPPRPAHAPTRDLLETDLGGFFDQIAASPPLLPARDCPPPRPISEPPEAEPPTDEKETSQGWSAKQFFKYYAVSNLGMIAALLVSVLIWKILGLPVETQGGTLSLFQFFKSVLGLFAAGFPAMCAGLAGRRLALHDERAMR